MHPKMDNLIATLSRIVIMTWYITPGIRANLEGPFLFWGPSNLEAFRRPALQCLEEDELMKIYEQQPAIVVFNNQDSAPLSSGSYPRLRKLTEQQPTLVLPQDFLDVHPDYVNNDTQVFMLEGPSSERDAEITETFKRLEDIYGSGKVLGILGNSMSQEYEERDAEYERRRRDAGAGARRRRADTDADADAETDDTTPRPDKVTPDRTLPEYALYNASGASGKALLYSSSWPVLRFDSGEEILLRRPLTATVSAAKLGGKQFTKLAVTFSHDNTKISVQFRITTGEGWWTVSGVEVSHLARDVTLLLQPPAAHAPAAALQFSYHCSMPLVFRGYNATLSFADIQLEPFMDSTSRFSDSFDCTGFTTVPIWSGVVISLFLVFVLSLSVCMILDIKTMDRFENTKGKCLTITVSE